MKKVIFNIVFALMIFAFSSNSAWAFAFVDISALAQRAVEFIKNANHWTDTSSHYKQVVDYAKKFNDFKSDFAKYQSQYERMYKNISRGTYASAFNVAKWDWTKLDEHLIKSYRAWDRAWYDSQMMIIRAGKLYMNNPLYKKFVDEIDEINRELLLIDEQEHQFLKDSDDRLKEHAENSKKIQKLIGDIATGDFASGENQQLALQAATSELQNINLQITLEESRKRNAEVSFSKQREFWANKGLQKQVENAAINLDNGGDVVNELSNLDTWVGRVRACAHNPKSAECKNQF